MKKLSMFVLILILLIGCQQQTPKDSKLVIDENKTSYKYKVDGQEEALTLYIPSISKGDSEDQLSLELVYSLNPLKQNENDLGLSSSLYFKQDSIDPDLKELVYSFAYYGYGFWELTSDGQKKAENKETLSSSDYTIHHGDFVHKNDLNNEEKINYYLATQELIWESMVNPETQKNYQVEFIDVDLENVKEKILQVMLDQKRVPFSKGNVLNVNEDDIEGEKLFTIEDNEKILNRFEIEQHPDIVVTEQTNELLSFKLIRFTPEMSIGFSKKFIINQEHSYLFNSDNDVSYVSIGDDHFKTIQEVHIEHTTQSSAMVINIATYDNETKELLEGAQYEISDGPEFTNPISSSVSTNHEKAKFLDLEPGKYYLQQVKTPKGYIESSNVIEFTVEEGIKLKEIPFINEKLPESEAKENQ